MAAYIAAEGGVTWPHATKRQWDDVCDSSGGSSSSSSAQPRSNHAGASAADARCTLDLLRQDLHHSVHDDDAVELDLEPWAVPPGWEKCLDLKTGRMYIVERGSTAAMNKRLSNMKAQCLGLTEHGAGVQTTAVAVMAALDPSSKKPRTRECSHGDDVAAGRPSTSSGSCDNVSCPRPPEESLVVNGRLNLGLNLALDLNSTPADGDDGEAAPSKGRCLDAASPALPLSKHMGVALSSLKQHSSRTSSPCVSALSFQEAGHTDNACTSEPGKADYGLLWRDEDGDAADASPAMMTLACARCLMFVMVSPGDPRCPRCRTCAVPGFLERPDRIDFDSSTPCTPPLRFFV